VNRTMVLLIFLIVAGSMVAGDLRALPQPLPAGEPGSQDGHSTISGEPTGADPLQSSPGDPELPVLSFGSKMIFDSCWSLKELEGSPEDKRLKRPMARPYRNSPERTVPKLNINPVPVELRNSIRSVRPHGNSKVIALTFDLCESGNEISGYDPDIVNYLRRKSLKATFFVGGKWMQSHPEKTMQLIADPLFEIGNHGWTHRNFRLLDRQGAVEQVLWTQTQYELLWEELAARPCASQGSSGEILKIPKVPLTFRFPFGACNSEALEVAALSGLPVIQWSVVTGDAAPRQSPQAITKAVLEQTRPGSIIVCHANGRGHGTAKALTLFIPKLLESGYQFVTISELLASGSAVAARECFELKPGDNSRYDRFPYSGKK